MIRNCIPKEAGEKLKSLIKDGEVSVDELKTMSSKKRTELFSKYIGDDMAKKLSVGFDQRLNSKRIDVLDNYIERELTAVPRKIKSSLTEKITDMKKLLDPKALDEDGIKLNQEVDAFLDELVAHKVGAYIDPNTAQRLLKFAEKAQTLRKDITKVSEKIAKGDKDILKYVDTLKLKYGATGKVKPIKGQKITMEQMNELSEARLTFGRADFDVKSYMESVVKQKQEVIPLPDGILPKSNFVLGKAIKGAASVSKAVKATMDNSVFGRQGWKNLFMDPVSWKNNFLKSWVDIGRTFTDLKTSRQLIDTTSKPTEFFYENVMREVHAEIVSRPNALRGAYRAATNEFGLNVSSEELFPQLFDYAKGSWREKAFGNVASNVLVRGHKGFENAFSAGALRMRADIADGLIAHVERTEGISVLDKNIANALGNVTSSITGRGELGKLGAIGNELNTILFSPRFFKSQIDTILHPYQLATHTGVFSNIPPEVRKVVAQRYIRYLGGNAALLGLLATGGLTSLDPRSDAFGYLVIGERKFDMTGGQRGMFALMARMATTKRKNFTTGTIYDVGERYGYDKGDELYNFLEGKMSPLAGTTWRLLTSGTNFDGYEIRPTSLQNTKNLINELLVPITLGEGINMFSQEEPARISGIIAEFLGVGNRVQVSRPNSGKWGELLNSDKDKYDKAIDEYNAELWKLVRKNSRSVKIKKMTKEELADYYDKQLKSMKKDILKDYEKYIKTD